VPTTWVDGIYEFVGGGSSNYGQYRNAFNIRKNVSSPFVINLDGDYSPQTHSGHITAEIIAESSPPSNLRLRYAIVETDIEYAWSGEDSLYFVERDMFPSATGVSISMAQGDTLYDTQNYSFDPDWNFINSYIAVFIQCETNKEVQQAAQWSIPINVPNISIVDKLVDDSSGDNDGRADPGETVDLIISLYNSPPFMPATNVSATLSSSDPDISITHGTVNFPDIPVDSTVTNASDPFVFSVDAGASVHRAEFILDVSAQPNNYNDSDTFELMIGRPGMILIDNDGGESAGNVEDYFYVAIDDIGGLLYDFATDSAVEMNHLDEYDVVIWFTGNLRSNTVSSSAQTLLANYLDGGGKLFITGQDIGYDIGGSSFYSDYLRAVYTLDDANYWYLLGVAGDPIGDGFGFLISGGGGANNQGSPDVISKMADSDSVFEYAGAIGPCAVRYNSGTFKTVYFSFGFEAIQNSTLREDVMRRVLQWLDYLQGVEEEKAQHHPLKPSISVAPNPFVSTAILHFLNSNDKQVSVEIHDLSGRIVWSGEGGGQAAMVWNGTDFAGNGLPAGVYFVNAKVGVTKLEPEKLILMR
jgi:hypothetical protein